MRSGVYASTAAVQLRYSIYMRNRKLVHGRLEIRHDAFSSVDTKHLSCLAAFVAGVVDEYKTLITHDHGLDCLHICCKTYRIGIKVGTANLSSNGPLLLRVTQHGFTLSGLGSPRGKNTCRPYLAH